MEGRTVEEQDSHTNDVWHQGDGTILKQFSRFSWTVRVMDGLQTLLLSPSRTTRPDRIQNEIRAKDVLQECGINTQTVIDYTDEHLLVERVPGQDLFEFLQQADPDACFDAGYRKGRELQTLHEHGHAYIDCHCGNTIIDGDTLYAIDHELFEQDTTGRVHILDLVTLLGTAKLLPSHRYQPFRNGVRAGYTENDTTRWMRAVLELPCALGYAVLAEQDIRGALHVVQNWVREHIGRN